jgi:hypothetical protein
MPKDRSDQAFKAVTSPGFAIFFIIGIFVLAAIPGGCYLLNFALGSGGKPSADPKDWATLGSFLSGTTGVVLSLGNFCLAAFILLWLHHRRFREEIAFAFHKEWTDLMKRRTEADAFLDKFPGDSLEVHYNAKGDGLAPVWDLIGFYERLEISVTHGRVSHELFFRLFGQIFTWWYYVAFCASPKVVVDHEARRATAAKTPTPAEANRATSAPIVGEIASVDPVNVGVERNCLAGPGL